MCDSSKGHRHKFWTPEFPTNSRNDVTVRLVRLHKRSVTAVDSARCIPENANNRILDQTVRNRLKINKIVNKVVTDIFDTLREPYILRMWFYHDNNSV